MRAHALYHRDQHYVVQDDEVVIVDEFTGRMMQGRRWSDGLHQAVEAKEGVSIKNESQTLASITFQNYFRLYKKLAGMTGTADTEAFEFSQHLQPRDGADPHAPPDGPQGPERPGLHHREGEVPGDHQRREGLPRAQPAGARGHDVDRELRAHLRACCEKEGLAAPGAQRQAARARGRDRRRRPGRPKMVTIATNMAGRGTDIVLGGNPEPEIQRIKADEALADAEKERRIAEIREDVAEAAQRGGRRRGACTSSAPSATSRGASTTSCAAARRARATRAPRASSCPSRTRCSRSSPASACRAIMRSLKIPEGEAIEAKMVTRSIENAQRKVEARNFDIRKQLLEYDDVANDQRKVIYAQRNELLETARHLAHHLPPSAPTCSGPSVPRVRAAGQRRGAVGPRRASSAGWRADFFIVAPVHEWARGRRDARRRRRSPRSVIEQAARRATTRSSRRSRRRSLHQYERAVMLQSIDSHWREHLAALDYLRQGIHLRGYAQKQPKQEYKREAFELFGAMLDSIKREVTQHLMAVQIRSQARGRGGRAPRPRRPRSAVKNVQYHHADYDEALARRRRGAAGRGGRRRRAGGPALRARRRRRSAATIRAPAAPARSTSTATASSPEAGRPRV